MSVIRWQFYSLKNEPFNAIKFSGIDISVADFKDLIMKEKGMKSETSKLVVIDASNNEEYTDDTDMIPRNKQVYIRKVPIKQVSGPLESRGTAPPEEAPTLTAKDLIDSKTVDLATANATEEDKLRAAMDQASQYYHPSQFTRTRGIRGRGFQKPPPNYVCHSCGGKDHFRQQCPKGKGEAQASLKRATGFPSSHLLGVTRQGPGVLQDSKGNLVISRADVNVLMPHTQNKAASGEGDVVEIPPELVCRLCEGLIKDAVIIPCCGENYCDECIRNHLLEHDFLCPNCNVKMSPDKLVINKNLRMYAQKFRSRLHPGVKLSAGKKVMGDLMEEAELGGATPPTQDEVVTKTIAETSARSSPVPSDTNTPRDSPQRGVTSRENESTPQGSPTPLPAISAPIVMAPQQQQQPHPLARTALPLPPTLPSVMAPTFIPRPVPYNPFQLTTTVPAAGQGLGGIMSSLVPAATLTVSQPKRAITAPIDTTKHTPPPISKEMFLKLQTEARRKEIERLKRDNRIKRRHRGRSESVSSRGSTPSRSPTPPRLRDGSQRRSPALSRSRSPREPPRKHRSSAKHKKRRSEKENHAVSSSKTSSSKHHKSKKHRRSRSHSGSDASSSKRRKISGATVGAIPESGMDQEVERVSASGSNATTSRPDSPLLSPAQGETPKVGHSVVNSPSYSSVEGESLLDDSDNDMDKSGTNVVAEEIGKVDQQQEEGLAASCEVTNVAVAEEEEQQGVLQGVQEEVEQEVEEEVQGQEETEPDQVVQIAVTEEEEEDVYAEEEVGSGAQTQPVVADVAVNGLEEGEIVEEEEKEKDMREVLSELRKVNKTLPAQTDSKDRKRKHKPKHSKKVAVKETSSESSSVSDDSDDSSDSASDSDGASYSDDSPSTPSEDERQRRRHHKAKRRRVEVKVEQPRSSSRKVERPRSSSRKVKHSSSLSSAKKHTRKGHKEREDGARESSRHRKEKRSRHEREKRKDSRHEKRRKKSKVTHSSEERHRKHRTSKHSRKVKHRS